MSEPEVVLHGDADLLAVRTAERTVSALGQALAEREQAHLVVTGGSILEAVLAELPAATQAAPVDWQRVHVWWGDERYVPAGDTDRNDRPAMAKAFDHLPVEAEHLHPMPASDAGFGDDLGAAADSYAAALAAVAGDAAGAGIGVPAFDVVLLGLGPDGHCASLFPGHPGTRVLDTSVIGVRESPKPPPNRLSLTFPALDAAREIWFVAAGEGKADAVARALGGASREDVPSAGPRGTQRTLWLVDSAAAAQLNM